MHRTSEWGTGLARPAYVSPQNRLSLVRVIEHGGKPIPCSVKETLMLLDADEAAAGLERGHTRRP
jgi:hypothetical protein